MAEKDVNVVLEEIFMTENSHYETGREQGKEMAEKQNMEQGVALGVSKGFELAQEIGFYKGFIDILQEKMNSEMNSDSSNLLYTKRAVGVVSSLNTLLDDFCSSAHHLDLMDEDLTKRIEKIQNKFMQAMSLLKLDVSYSRSVADRF